MLRQRPSTGFDREILHQTNYRSLRLRPQCYHFCDVEFDPPLPIDTAAGTAHRLVGKNKAAILEALSGATEIQISGRNCYVINCDQETIDVHVVVSLDGRGEKALRGEGEENEDGDGDGETPLGVHRMRIKSLQQPAEFEDEEGRKHLALLLNRGFSASIRAAGFRKDGSCFWNPKKGDAFINRGNLKLFQTYSAPIHFFQNTPVVLLEGRKQVRQDETALQVLEKIRKRNHSSEEAFRFECEEALLDKYVVTMHGNDAQRYRISEILWDQNIDSEFERETGKNISFRDFFKQLYNITLNAPKGVPILRTNRKIRKRAPERSAPALSEELGAGGRSKTRTVELPPEICWVLGVDREAQADWQMMRRLSEFCRQTPAQKVDEGKKLFDMLRAHRSASGLLESFGIELGDQPFETVGRQVAPSRLLLMTGKEDLQRAKAQRGDDEAPGVQLNMTNLSLQKNIEKEVAGFVGNCEGFKNWAVAYFPKDRNASLELTNKLYEIAQERGMDKETEGPKEIALDVSDPVGDLQKQLKEKFSTPRGPPSIILVVLPKLQKSRSSPHYAKLKEAFCTGLFALPTQCVLADTIEKKGKAAAVRIFDQMICKQGGYIWAINLNVPGASGPKRTMAVGVKTLTAKGRTLVAFSASRNAVHTKYFSYSRWLSGGPGGGGRSHQAIGPILREFLRQALVFFRDNWEEADGECPKEDKDRIPHRVVIYRDGSGGPSVRQQADHEVREAKAAFREVDERWGKGGDWCSYLEFVFLSVYRDTRPRFFRVKEGGGLVNPLPQTVFSDGVQGPDVHFCMNNFYINHHSVTQGCAAPTKYALVAWENKPANTEWATDELQILTAQLSLLYQNWPGAVRAPAPLMYADKQCKLYTEIQSRDAVNRQFPWMLKHLYFL